MATNPIDIKPSSSPRFDYLNLLGETNTEGTNLSHIRYQGFGASVTIPGATPVSSIYSTYFSYTLPSNYNRFAFKTQGSISRSNISLSFIHYVTYRSTNNISTIGGVYHTNSTNNTSFMLCSTTVNTNLVSISSGILNIRLPLKGATTVSNIYEVKGIATIYALVAPAAV